MESRTCTAQWGPIPRLWSRGGRSEEPVCSALRSLVCFGPKKTGFIPGHPRSQRPRLNMELSTWPMIKLVFRNSGKCSWTQITGLHPVALLLCSGHMHLKPVWTKTSVRPRGHTHLDLWLGENWKHRHWRNGATIRREMEAKGGRGSFPCKRKVSLREVGWGAGWKRRRD